MTEFWNYLKTRKKWWLPLLLVLLALLALNLYLGRTDREHPFLYLFV